MTDPHDETRVLSNRGASRQEVRDKLLQIYGALQEKGYDPIRQIAHFLLSGEPTYITAHKNARALAGKLERDEVLEEILTYYLEHLDQGMRNVQ